MRVNDVSRQMRFRIVLSALLSCLVTTAHTQQSVQLEFGGGRVWLIAHDAAVRAILSEWMRRGGTTIVNIDRVEGAPVTLELMGVTERDALDSVLRGVAGYMIASRPVTTDGVSTFDRILILSPTTAPGPVATANAHLISGRVDTPGERSPDQDEDVDDERDPLARLLRSGPPRVDVPPSLQIIGTRSDTEDAQPATTAPKPTGIFGAPSGSSATPGIVTPASPGSTGTPVTRPPNRD